MNTDHLRFDLTPTRMQSVTLEALAHFLGAVEQGDRGNQAPFLALLMLDAGGRRLSHGAALTRLCALSAEDLQACAERVAEELTASACASGTPDAA